jgi:hypothetical protein
MRHSYGVVLAAAFGLLGTGTVAAQSQTDRILDRAIQAHGGAANLTRLQARQIKMRGQLFMETPIAFVQEFAAQPPHRIKEITQFQAGKDQVTKVTIFHGTTGRMELNGKNQPLNESMLNELKERAYSLQLAHLVELKKKEYRLTPLGESAANGRSMAGIRVENQGHREIKLYFDQEYGVLAKMERMVLDLRTQQMICEESLYSDWKVVDGLVTPTRVTVLHDGYKFLEVEVTEIHFLEKLSGGW